MNSVRLLYDLQMVDQDIDSRKGRLLVISSALGNEEALAPFRGQVKILQERVDCTSSNQKEMEAVIDSLSKSVGEAEHKLYSGLVKSPRELTDLQADVNQLQRQRATHEERLLEVLNEIDGHRAELETLAGELHKLETEWNANQSAMADEKQILNGEVQKISKTRSTMAQKISSAELSLYERVRKTHKGWAVARVQQTRCEACNITLANRELQQLRSNSTPVRCSNCGFILLVD